MNLKIFKHGHCGILRRVVNISEFLHQELVVVDKINTKLMLLCGKEEIDKDKQVD